jgi:hypothetical protein
MIEKPKKPNKSDIQDRLQPTTIEGLIQKYDLDNIQIYEYLEYLVNYLNEKGV